MQRGSDSAPEMSASVSSLQEHALNGKGRIACKPQLLKNSLH